MSDEAPRLRQSIVRMLQRMEEHHPGVYREIQLTGRPGAWKVDVLRGDQHTASQSPAASLADALTLALMLDLNAAPPPPECRSGLHCGDLFGPLS